MKLSKVILKGFRNFKQAKINFNEKTLIIGANDVGKTNLIWALRLLLDKGLSEYDIEPKDSDFYAYDEVNNFKITLKFEKVIEDCVVAKLKGQISDDDELYMRYEGLRDAITKAKSYKLFVGPSIEGLEEIQDRFYRKVVNLRYISCRRDFHSYINKEKHNLLYLAKESRSEEEATADDVLINQISTDLKNVDDKIPKLAFIATATKTINEELAKLSIHNKKQSIVFDAASSNIDTFINSVSIASRNNDRSLLIGGDGRLNQVYLSLWAARNEISEENLQEVSIICIEEPEAHLHPHQQRKLSEYLSTSIKSQVITTSHSPQIACEYSPNSIVRLVDHGNGAFAASDGCSEIIAEVFNDFGYRLSIIPAEAFFADAVLLVEGPSEELFYKTLSKQLGIDLDRLNISILMVDGIGFKTFIEILNALEIAWALRTDNDIFKVPKKNERRYAGVQRCVSFYKMSYDDNDTNSVLEKNEKLLTGFPIDKVPDINSEAAIQISNDLRKYGIFLSDKDLENDLYNSAIKADLDTFFGQEKEEEHEDVEEDDDEDEGEDDIVKIMQKKKAIFMFEFLKEKKDTLTKLENHPLTLPLIRCKEIIQKIQNGTD